MNQSAGLTTYQRQAILWFGVAFALGVLFYFLGPILTPFLLGAIFAYMLYPGCDWLHRHRVPRGLAAFLMILALLIVLTLLALLVIAAVQKEGPQLREQIPALLAKLNDSLAPRLSELGINLSFDFPGIKQFLTDQFAGSTDAILKQVLASLRTSGNVALALVSNLIMVPLVLFYLLYDWHDILRRVRQFIPRRWLERTMEMVVDINQVLSQYLRGQLLVMGVLAIYYSVCLAIAGFDVALPVGIFTGLAVFIPYIGFGTGLVLALLAALLQFGDFYGFAAVAVIYGIGQVLESFYLTPRLVGERIGLHPLAVIFALLAFGQLFGFFGVLLALPVSAILMTASRQVRRAYLSSTFYKN